MTTGYVLKGSFDSPSRFYKNWNGVDGRGTPPGSQWNAYGVVIEKFAGSPGSGNSWGAGFYIHPTTAFSSPWTASDEFALASRITSAVKGHQFNLGVSLATGNQTVKLAADTLRRFATSVRALKRGDISSALRSLGVVDPPRYKTVKVRGKSYLKKYSGEVGHNLLISKDISAMWLEIQYGWKPLLSDVYEAGKALEASTSAPRKSRLTVQSFRTSTRKGEVQPGDPKYGSWTCTDTYSVRLLVELTETLSTPRSIGLTDPLTVAWELIPFSFVVDWFIPIGAYLENLNTIPRLSGRVLQTTKRVHSGEAIGGPFPCPGPYYNTCQFSGARSAWETIQIGRSVGNTLPNPMPSFKTMDQALSLGHLKNAAALLHQLVT